jgi:mannosyltransferase
MARLRTLALILVLLLAFALRLYHLDFQSLEGDEGISLQRSSQPFEQMIERMPVEHVPGYFVLLFGWLRVAGESDFALRYLSVLPSVAAVALIYRWAASMGRPLIGMIAALLLATNSFQIWYAQQARMYSWLLMSSLFSFWALWRMVDGKARDKRWTVDAIYILSTATTVYLHYFGFLIPVAQTIFMAIWSLVEGSWRTTRRWLIDGVIIFLLFLPWLGKAITFLGFQGWREPLDPWQVPWLMHSAYSVGFPMPQPWQTWLPWLYLGLAVLGLVVWWRQHRSAWMLLVVATFVPALLIFIAVLRNPDFHERYSMFLAAPWLLLIAGGIGALLPSSQRDRQRIPVGLGASLLSLLVIVLVAANGLALNRLYFDTSLHKADYRGAAYRIHSNEKPGDAVLVDGPNPDLVFNHYYQDEYRGLAPVYDLRPLADQEYDEISEALLEYTQGAERVWEVLYFRAPGPVQFWLATHGWASAPTDHNGIRLSLYALDRGPLVTQAMATPFGEGLTLAEAGVEGPIVQPGDLLRVSTRWQVASPLPDYKFSLRLLTQDGQVILADDYMPQNWFAPTSQWSLGEVVDQRALFLPVDLPAGPYQIALRLYDPANGVPVETPAGQDVVLGTVEVGTGQASTAEVSTVDEK